MLFNISDINIDIPITFNFTCGYATDMNIKAKSTQTYFG